MMAADDLTPFTVGEWRVDPVAKQIARGAEAIKVDPRNMRLLVLLASRPGEIWSQEEIEQGAWPGIVVTPNSVYQAIAQLRRAFGEEKSSRRYIETVSRRGYRLVAPVSRESQPPVAAEMLPVANRSRRRVWLLSGVAAVGVLAAIVVLLLVRHAAPPASRSTEQVSPAQADAGLEATLPESYQSDRAYRDQIDRLEHQLAEQGRALGENDVTLVPALVGLANLYPLTSQPLKSEQVARRGMSILEMQGGMESAAGVELEATLAEVLADTNRYPEAEQHLGKATQRSRRLNGELEYAVIGLIDQLALLRIAEGRFAEAVDVARRAVAQYARSPSAHTGRAAYLRSTLAWALVEQGSYDEAIRESEIALRALKPTDPPAPYLVALSHHFLGEALVKAGRYADAERELRIELDLFTKIPHCPMDGARGEGALAEALMRQGRSAEAETLLVKATHTLETGDGWRERKSRRETAARFQELKSMTAQAVEH